jgi:hypothetical protein
MDGKQIFIFGNFEHSQYGERWQGTFSKQLRPIALGEFYPGEVKMHVMYYQAFIVAQSLN